MTLIKTSLLNAIAVVIKMLTLLGLNKVLAVYVGPVGYAALGQFQNAVQMITTFASGAINTGVTKYTAEYYDDINKQRQLWRTAGTVGLIGSLLTACLIALFSQSLAIFFFKDGSFSGVFIWFALTLTLFTFNSLLLAILNGKKEIVRYVMANIAGSLFAFSITTVMAIKLGLYGALIALATYQSIVLITTMLICYKAPWFRFDYLIGSVHKESAINLAKFTAMALTSAACVPVSHILIRNHLGETHGWEVAGYWEASWRLSTAYLMLVTSTISIYFLPRFSELKDLALLRQEVVRGYKTIVPAAVVFGIVIYVLRDFIIQVLFSIEFINMRDLFLWQIVGDTLKIMSWVLAYVITARALWKPYIVGELLTSGLFYSLVLHFSERGAVGASLAHALTYLFYLGYVVFVMRIYVFPARYFSWTK